MIVKNIIIVKKRLLYEAVMAYILVPLSGLGMAFCQYLIYYYAPIESELGIIQKIFYLHLTFAWWALISFFIVCIASIGYLKTRKTYWDALSGATAEIGVILSSAAITTGSIWGKQVDVGSSSYNCISPLVSLQCLSSIKTTRYSSRTTCLTMLCLGNHCIFRRSFSLSFCYNLALYSSYKFCL